MEEKEADYKIKAKPTKNKSWKEAENIEIVLTLNTKDSEKVFRGVITLTGIIKK